MTSRRSLWALAAVVLAVAVAGVPTDAAAKKSKKVFTAVIDGRRFKPAPRWVGLGAGGGTVAFRVSGAKVVRSLRGISKSVLVTCVNDLGVQTFPFTTTDCLANYTETRVRPLLMRIWQTLQTGATTVTFDSYDGARIAGRFHVVVPAFSNPDLPPVTIDGEFRGPVEHDDPSR